MASYSARKNKPFWALISAGTAPQLHFTVCGRDWGTERALADCYCMRRKQSFSASLFSLSPSSSPLLFSALLPCLSLLAALLFLRAFFQPRPHSLAPSLCAVMKISQAAAHNGVPTSGAQTPQILSQAALTPL